MNVESSIRLIAGGFVMASVLLGLYVDPRFLWFTLFVGANLFRPPVLVERHMLVWRVIEGAVARAVGDDRALPQGPDHVHVAGAGLDQKSRLRGGIDGPNRGEEAAHQRILTIGPPGWLPAAELQGELRAPAVERHRSSRDHVRRVERRQRRVQMSGAPCDERSHQLGGIQTHRQTPGELRVHGIVHLSVVAVMNRRRLGLS
jgi:hypothetical protein